MSPHLTAVVTRMRAAGCVFPASPATFYEHRVYSRALLKELAQEGLIENPELYDSNLPDKCLSLLEHWGVTSRAHFRRLYQQGRINITKAWGLGVAKEALILRWAGLPPRTDAKEHVSVQLSVPACEGLQLLKKRMDLPTRDLVLECLIADAVRAHTQDNAPPTPGAALD